MKPWPEDIQKKLDEASCKQLLVVRTDRHPADIRWYERHLGRFVERRSLCAKGAIGFGGVTRDKREGDGCTPCGLFPVGEAFYIGRPPKTGLNRFAVTERTCWVDDPHSRYYNRRVEECGQRDWESAERMMEYQEYVCGFVIEHNPACHPEKGSAVFFHVLADPPEAFLATGGCVAAPEPAVRRYLKRLCKKKHPYILIK